MNVNVPALDIDKEFARQGHHVGLNGRVERRIVAALIQHLDAAGFQVANVFDSEETTPVANAKEAMELIFNLDEAWLRFYVPASHPLDNLVQAPGVHTVFLAMGNGEDIISDWNYSRGDRDGFNVAMEAFRPEEAI